MKTARLLLASDWPPVWYEGIRDPSRLWKPKVQVSGLVQNSFAFFYIFFISGKLDCQVVLEGQGSIPSL